MPSSDRFGGVGFHLSITSPANPRIKDLARARRRRHRSGTLVDGFAELSLAVAAGARPRAVYFCPALADDRTEAHAELLERCARSGAELIHVTAVAFEKITYRRSPDGWLGVLPAVATGLDRIALRPGALVLVCESVEKPGNLGAVLRTADAAGVDAVIAAGPVTDWGNPNLVRASKGALFTVPVAEGSPVEVLEWLRAQRLTVVAATPDAARPFFAVDMTGPTAIVVGSEQSGLSELWLAGADEKVGIPMVGRVDSLNVATSAAILVYEAVRQRGVRDRP
jgi:TrmH family RNA methyltransferase